MSDTLVIRARDPDHASPAEWCVQAGALANTQGQRDVRSGTLGEALAAAGALSVSLVIPGEDCLLCSIDLPIRNKSKLLKALPYALEERLIEDPETLHFAVGPRTAAGKLCVVVIARERLQAWLDSLAQARVNAAVIVPDLLCLHTPAEGRLNVLLDRPDHVIARSAADVGFAGELALLTDTTSLQPEIQTDVILAQGAALPAGFEAASTRGTVHGLDALREQAVAPFINLLQGSFAPRNSMGRRVAPLRLSAALALACVVLAVASAVAEHVTLKHRLAALTQQQQQLLASEFPQIHRWVEGRERAQAEQALQRLRAGGGGGTLYTLAKVLTEALTKVPGLQLQSLQLRDGQMSLEMTGSNLQTLDGLRGFFASLPNYALDVQSANASNGKVSIRASLEAR